MVLPKAKPKGDPIGIWTKKEKRMPIGVQASGFYF